MSYRSSLTGLFCLGALVASAVPGLACPRDSVYGCPPAQLSAISSTILDAPPATRHQRPAMAVELPSMLARAVVSVTDARPAIRTSKSVTTFPRTRVSIPTPRLETTDDTLLEMPWIWQVLKRKVYDRLPRYEELEDRQPTLSIVLAPVIVAGKDDTVPGVGLSGDF